jgi:hypothetical protein
MMPSSSLIPAHRIALQRRRARSRQWSGASGLYVLLLLAVFVTCRIIRGDGTQALADAGDEVQQQIAQSQRTLGDLRPRVDDARRTLDANRAVGNQPDWSVLLALISRCMHKDVVLSKCRIKPAAAPGPAAQSDPAKGPGRDIDPQALRRRTYILILQGVAPSQADMARSVLNLEGTRLFDHVRLVKTTRQTFRGVSAVHFDVECELSPTGGATP